MSIFYTMCRYSVLVLLVALGSTTYANTRAPEWQAEPDVDLTAFQYTVDVLIPEGYGTIQVPTVIEVPVVGASPRNKTAVAVDHLGGVAPAWYKTYTTEVAVREIQAMGTAIAPPLLDLYSFVPDESPSWLVDDQQSTVVEFDYRGEGTFATVMITFEEPITTSQLRITRDPNVTLPDTVRIQAGEIAGDTTDLRDVVATKKMVTDVVRFPETTSKYFEIHFELSQPLRLRELSFVQATPATEYDTIRFLAQPGYTYTLYVSPDRPYGNVPTGGVRLDLEQDVEQVGVKTFTSNPRYVLSDKDEDGVPDTRDNCPLVANSTQTDVNQNEVGDVCDDFDRDGIMMVKDNCPEVPNSNQRDTDGDGVGDACDEEENRFTEANPWVPWIGMSIAILVVGGLLILALRLPHVAARTREEQDTEAEGEGAVPPDETR